MSPHCIRLVVESRNPHTGFWEKVAVFTPEYVYEEEIVPHWYWWTRKIRDIANCFGAYKVARVAAIKAAKNQRGEVRVKDHWNYATFGPSVEVIWKDGKFLDDH